MYCPVYMFYTSSNISLWKTDWIYTRVVCKYCVKHMICAMINLVQNRVDLQLIFVCKVFFLLYMIGIAVQGDMLCALQNVLHTNDEDSTVHVKILRNA